MKIKKIFEKLKAVNLLSKLEDCELNIKKFLKQMASISM